MPEIFNCKFICHKRNFSVFNLNFEQIPNKFYNEIHIFSPVVNFNIHWKAIALKVLQSQINVKVKAKRVFK